VSRTVIALALVLTPTLSAQRVAPPPRPVTELRLLLARFNNGTAGFSAAELARGAIGFSQAARDGEFALAYFEDRGDNAIHAPLHLAISRAGRPWTRATIDRPADKIGASGGLFLGADYLLTTSLTNENPRQHILVFSKDLRLEHAIDGGLDREPFPNGVVLFHSSPDHEAIETRASLGLFDIHTGVASPLYPAGTQGQPSAAYQKQLPELVRRLNEAVAHGNFGRGYKVEWYASLRITRPEYDPARDALSFTQVIAPTWPIPPVPGLKSAIESIPVACGPMLKPHPKCTEGARSISVWPKAR
jgi:hypothetical protein